jgi:hypothetical protein
MIPGGIPDLRLSNTMLLAVAIAGGHLLFFAVLSPAVAVFSLFFRSSDPRGPAFLRVSAACR